MHSEECCTKCGQPTVSLEIKCGLWVCSECASRFVLMEFLSSSLDNKLKGEIAGFQSTCANNTIVIRNKECIVLQVNIDGANVLVQRAVPSYESDVHKLNAADPQIINKIVDVLYGRT